MSKAPVATIREPLTAHVVAAAPVEQVLRWLDSSADGLSSAQASERLAQDGPNAIRTHHVSAWAVLVRQLNNAVLILLAITAVLSYFLGDHTQALIIGVILTANIGLGFFNEYRAEQTAAALHSRIHPERAVQRHLCPHFARASATVVRTRRARVCLGDLSMDRLAMRSA